MSESCFCGETSYEVVRETIRGGKEQTIVECDRCSAFRKFPLDVGRHRELHRQNEQIEQLDIDALSESYRERTLIDVERRVNAIRPLLGDSDAVLDFGTGMGHFLEAVDLLAESVVGSEINDERLAFIEENLGYPVYDGTDELLATFDDGHFDAITLFHVVEHLPDPVGQLETIRRLLDDDGLVVVEVPNKADWLLSASGAYSDFYFQDAHSYYFDPTSLRLVFEKAGYDVSISGVQRYSLRNALHWLAKNEPEIDAPSRHRDSWADPVDKVYAELLKRTLRCDTLWAVARKRDQ